MTPTTIVNRYSFIASLVLLILPLLYLVKQNVFTSYFDAFDRLSIPVWAGLYSLFWIIFDKQIKKLNRQIPVLQDRVNAYKSIGNSEYRTVQKEDEEKLAAGMLQLSDAKLHFEFINTTLRATVILAALVKIIQLVIDLFK